MAFNIFLTLFLVFLNGFFVAAEFAIVKVRTSQINTKIDSHISARVAASILDNLDGYLAATQLGITLASLGLGWIGEAVVSEIIIYIFALFQVELTTISVHAIALPLSFTLITVLHIVFGELTPKALAIRYPTETTLFVSSPLRFFYYVFKPFIWVLNGFANFLLRLIGLDPIAHSDIHSEEELKLILAESAEGGAIKDTELDLIQNVFDFDDRLVKHVVTPRSKIVGLQADMTINEGLEVALREEYSRFPVYEDTLDNIIGFIHAKDIFRVSSKKENKTLRQLMRPIIYTPINKKLMDLLRGLQQKRIQMAVVTNEFGETTGIITMEDIIEELIGDIQDEHDTELPIVEKIDTNFFRIQAQQSLDQINEFLPESLPTSEEYETMAGFIMKELGDIPTLGQVIHLGNYDIKIVRMYKTTSPEIVEAIYHDPS